MKTNEQMVKEISEIAAELRKTWPESLGSSVSMHEYGWEAQRKDAAINAASANQREANIHEAAIKMWEAKQRREERDENQKRNRD